MQYRVNAKNGESISALGFGCMRFHRDEKETEKQIRYAIEHGVNYFDTAYIYSGSEATLGRILAKDGLRDKIHIATKLPYYLANKYEDFERIFRTELKRLQTDWIDYYLIHMLTDLQTWKRLVELGITDWIAEKKRTGQIRNIGFSFHGVKPAFIAVLDAYDWDFCMIQYNFLDVSNQVGTGGLEYAAQKGVPVVIMEPLRGGTLVKNLPAQAKALWDCAPEKRSPADWGLRWVLNHPQVLCVLSGMGTQEMVEQNIATASEAEAGALTATELELFGQVSAVIRAHTKVSCTGCGYCMPCPKNVDIPTCFASLNDTVIRGRLVSQYWYAITTKEHGASQCVQCGLCETHCPQAIPIREKLKQAQKELERFPYGILRPVIGRMLKRQG